MKRVLVAAVLMVGCSGGAAGGGTGGEAPAGTGGASSVTTSSSSGAGGDPGGGGAGGGEPAREPFELEITSCERGRIVGPLIPDEAGALAVGRFRPARLPAEVQRFRFVRISGVSQCGDVAGELVYFAAADGVPPESPAELHTMPLPPAGGGTEEVELQLDPPLQLTEEQPYAFLGVRMAVEGERSVCIGACAPLEHPDESWWSSAATAPFGWLRLSESPTPELGLQNDYAFSISGELVPDSSL